MLIFFACLSEHNISNMMSEKSTGEDRNQTFTEDYPHILVQPDSIDFGDIIFDSPPELASFTITNTGSAPLSLIDISLSISNGGFFFNEPPPQELARQQEQEFQVHLLSHDEGEFAGQITVESNDPTLPSVDLTLTARIGHGDLYIQPHPYDFGVLELGTEATQDFILNNTD